MDQTQLWQPETVIVVVATCAADVAAVRADLGVVGARAVDVGAPGETRRWVLATVNDETEAWRLAAMLRAEGMAAVARPEDGARFEAWIRHTRPISFGERLSVCFAWSEHDRTGLSNEVELGPGGSGNGEHPATRLLIEELLRKITGGESILDLGCGSGVLGLCALRLGASRVVATGVKEEAIEATRRNALLNGMDRQLRASLAPLGEGEGPFDVVVANVGRSAIVELAPRLVPLVAPDGSLAVSGISPPQCTLVAGFLRPLVDVERRTSGEWATLVLAHQASVHGEHGPARLSVTRPR